MNKSILLFVIAFILGFTVSNLTTEQSKEAVKTVVSNEKVSAENDVQQLLIKLGALIAKPESTKDSISGFLFDEYGPCWGIPEGQCKE